MIRKSLCLMFWLLCLPLCGVAAWAENPSTRQEVAPVDIVEWMFQRPLSAVEIQILNEQKGGERWAQLAKALDHPSEEQRLALLRRFKLENSPFASTACKLDRMARKEVAPGLQLQSTEAFAEWMLFGMAVLDGEDGTQVLPGPNFRTAVEDTLIGLWPTLSDHYREVLTGFPGYWANIRKDWPGMTRAAKEAALIGWRNNLANSLQKEDRIRLANSCLRDLQDTLASKPSPQALDLACDRLEFAARRMRSRDVGANQLADELSRYAAKARKQQAREDESTVLFQKMDVPRVWYSNIWIDSMVFPGYWGPWGGGWGNGYPYRW